MKKWKRFEKPSRKPEEIIRSIYKRIKGEDLRLLMQNQNYKKQIGALYKQANHIKTSPKEYLLSDNFLMYNRKIYLR